jgi:hypothetical protein
MTSTFMGHSAQGRMNAGWNHRAEKSVSLYAELGLTHGLNICLLKQLSPVKLAV